MGKLVVVSHTPHYSAPSGPVGWGATVRELDCLATLFDEVVHVAPLHRGSPPASSLAYRASNIRLRPVPAAGGPQLLDKLRIVTSWPRVAAAIITELRSADVAHIRAPANISLLALMILSARRQPHARWTKYAGNWRPAAGEPLSYGVQRWWLRRNWQRGVVTVNGHWVDQPPHVHSFLNPCLTTEELEQGRTCAAAKRLVPPIRIAFAGRVEAAKGVGRLLDIMGSLTSRGFDVNLDVVGDGPEQARFEQTAATMGLANRVNFLGFMPRTELPAVYRRAHFFLLPADSEGWPKVVSEAMAYGVVPIASAVGSIPQYLGEFGVGRSVPVAAIHEYVRAVEWYLEHPDEWHQEVRRGLDAAERFSYVRYLKAVRTLLGAGR